MGGAGIEQLPSLLSTAAEAAARYMYCKMPDFNIADDSEAAAGFSSGRIFKCCYSSCHRAAVK